MFITSDLVSTTRSGNVLLDALTYETVFVPGIRIEYVLQGAPGEGPFGGTTWSAIGARAAFAGATASWAAVANITFVEVAGPYDGTGPTGGFDWIETFEQLDAGVYGQHELPHEGTMLGTYSNRTGVFSAVNTSPGGDGFTTFVHEIGHGLGLLHPHNATGDDLSDPRFPGVNSPFDLGSNNLNQGIYTVMTYNDGFEEVLSLIHISEPTRPY